MSGQRPQPNKDGHIATTLEWARQLSADDVKVLKGQAAYSEKVPDPDEGFTEADLKDSKKAEAVYKVIRARLAKSQKERPGGYLVREAPADEIKLDAVFVTDLGRRTTATIVRHTVAMAHGLRMRVVAEGVEDAATADLLAELGCDIGQGLHFGAAMSAESLLDLLDSLR